ncbi:B3 domain-containing protein Os06g0194400-like [Lolium perenne]|uniref:B3 domain-containing protein Os06g0194400-like n=1 Tax=Lolium perenne TaxID=4522 RepID=UPI0021F691C1|nr:B3 domain-containing protein Os06g0194400-like isoform X2 [Lolium perenne]XP_051214629.1 B3 domain-containing protein Os06g0194400-like isoform X2 [Lolium perenne]XP_051214631.1 B3 domain-containing protein Os06g0194400-like isoform X2 [Lolium perenne]XP_051214632.1 B3 domain-containing protein Os06g0194400-like isoform X2 [Lolium perenne]
MAEANPYEEQRRRQVEENKSKLEELRLHRLSAAVRVAAVKPMPKVTIRPRNHRPPPDVIRRSARIARLDKQPYFRITKAHRDKKAELPRPVYATNEERAYAIAKAQELKDQLDSHYPAFLRPLSLSYAAGSWLSIPLQFSKRYLPRCDEMILLVDEEGAEFQVLYRAHSSALSATGWKPFASAHKLADGDCLLFQQVERIKFKVYIITASSYHETDH